MDSAYIHLKLYITGSFLYYSFNTRGDEKII